MLSNDTAFCIWFFSPPVGGGLDSFRPNSLLKDHLMKLMKLVKQCPLDSPDSWCMAGSILLALDINCFNLKCQH